MTSYQQSSRCQNEQAINRPGSPSHRAPVSAAQDRALGSIVRKLSVDQREEIIKTYLVDIGAAKALCAKYGVHHGRAAQLVSGRGLIPEWRRKGHERPIKPFSCAKSLPSQEWLKSNLDYNPDTGVFTRLRSRAVSRWVGKRTGSNSHGYVRITVADGFQAAAHRLAWIYMTGEAPAFQIDHIDGDRSNNRWVNLRAATNRLNQINVPKKRNNRSGYKGVCWCPRRGKWRATIVKNGKRVHLGFFDDPAAAHEVYATELTSFYGEFARVA